MSSRRPPAASSNLDRIAPDERELLKSLLEPMSALESAESGGEHGRWMEVTWLSHEREAEDGRKAENVLGMMDDGTLSSANRSAR